MFISKKALVLILSVATTVAAVTAPGALADTLAPGMRPESTGSTTINPSLTSGPAAVQIRQVPIDISAGVFNNSNGGKGLDLRASGNYDIFIWGPTDKPDTKFGAFKLGLGADGRIQISADGDSDSRKILSYRIASPSLSLVSFKYQDRYEMKTEHPGQADTYEMKPETTFSFDLLSVLYEKESNKPIGLKIDGALMEILKTNAQFAFKLNDVRFDICGGVEGVFHLGQTSLGQGGAGPQPVLGGAGLDACLGVQIGKLANLRDEFSASYVASPQGHMDQGNNWSYDQAADLKQVSNTVRAAKIGNTPVGLYWEHRYDGTDTGGVSSQVRSVTTDTFGLNGAF